jgi:hypothetical protein
MNLGTTKMLKINSLDEVLPELPEAKRLRERIQIESRKLKAEAAELRASISQGTSAAQLSRVEIILSGAQPPEPEADVQRLAVMHRRIADLDAAAEAQSKAISALEGRASVKICESLRGHHNKLATEICTKLLEVHDLHSKYTNLLEAITDKGASTASLPVLQSRLLEHPRYRESALGYALREAVQQGHIAAKSVPEALR